MELTDIMIERLRKKLATATSYEDLMGKDGAIRELLTAGVEGLLNDELTTHLGYEKHDPAGNLSGNSRNGKSKKTVKTEHGSIEIAVPRDRNGEFEPIAVPKHETRLGRIEEIIVSMYARGMSTRDIEAQIQDLYGVQLSAAAISQITDAVLARVQAWQSRPLCAVYPVIFFDAVHFHVRREGKVLSTAAYIVLAITTDGLKELLGIWIGEAEGAAFWHGILTELRNRGVEDIFIACIDGLKGFPDAITTVFPQTQVQLCIIHQIRSSMRMVTWKDRRDVMKDLRCVYKAATEEAALGALEALAQRWGSRYPLMIKSWRTNWAALATFFVYPPEIRRMIYTTNAVEALHRQLRKVTKSKAVFPNPESLRKMLFLAAEYISKKWTVTVQNWPIIFQHLALIFGDRLTRS
jgi:transposase-like protein